MAETKMKSILKALKGKMEGASLRKEHHNSVVAGHPGRARTLELLKRNYYWPRYYQFIARYIQNYHVCS